MTVEDETSKLYYLLRHRFFAECVELASELLLVHPTNQVFWFIKARALTAQSYVPDDDWQGESVADALLDNNATAQAPR